MIRTGTCSWTEKTLIRSGEFYPKGVSTAEARLRYYSTVFTTVEVDSTYYAIPDLHNSRLWAERTPEGFVFHVKAYGALTGHGIDPATLPRDLKGVLTGEERQKRRVYIKDAERLRALSGRFAESLMPLKRAGKLGLIIYQFPPWFVVNKRNMDFVVMCRELMEGMSLAVEFRHGGWLSPDHRAETFRFLAGNGLTYVTADEPWYGTLATVPFLPEATTDTAYFRFHGRNKGNWLKKGIETSLRYSYLYSDTELREFIAPARAFEGRAKEVYLMFNNCHGGFAVKNAVRMRELLEEE